MLTQCSNVWQNILSYHACEVGREKHLVVLCCTHRSALVCYWSAHCSAPTISAHILISNVCSSCPGEGLMETHLHIEKTHKHHCNTLKYAPFKIDENRFSFVFECS